MTNNTQAAIDRVLAFIHYAEQNPNSFHAGLGFLQDAKAALIHYAELNPNSFHAGLGFLQDVKAALQSALVDVKKLRADYEADLFENDGPPLSKVEKISIDCFIEYITKNYRIVKIGDGQ